MSEAWWGSQVFGIEQCVRWRIAGLSLWVRRAEHEWKVAFEWPPAWAESTVEVEHEIDAAPPDEDRVQVERYVVERTGEPLRLLPATADRSVVTTPRVPFFLGSKQKTRLYVGSPLWLRLVSGEILLREIPIHRPSDSFFGPSTMEGVISYATRSRAVLQLDSIEWTARRAVTPVQISNESDHALPIERLNIPVTMLSIFADGPRLWTECVEVVVGQEDLASVTVRPGPPQEAAGSQLLTEPRNEPEEAGLLMRVFDDLVSISRRI